MTAMFAPDRRRFALLTAGLVLPCLAATYQLSAIHLARTAEPAATFAAWAARLAASPWAIVLLVSEGVSFVLWLLVLGELPLAVAFPLTALGSALGLGVAAVALGATIPPLSWIGMAAILAGAWLIVGARE